MKELIYYIKKENNLLSSDNELFNELLNFINTNLIDNVNAIKIIKSFNNTFLLLLDLKKDQRHKIRTMLAKSTVTISSAYILVNNKLIHVFKDEFIEEIINNYKINIYPTSNFLNTEQSNLYSDIKYLSPKGKTRSAIVFDSHSGIMPIHISGLYNKIYAVDNDINSNKTAKINCKNNKVNNVLTYKLNYSDWMNNYTNGHYSSPGKKTVIGNLILSFSDYDENTYNFINITKPETIILYSNENFTANIKDYCIIKEFNPFNFYVKKLKCSNDNE